MAHSCPAHGHSHEDHCPQDFFENPIRVSVDPFWSVFKRFGKDETAALFGSLIGTSTLAYFSPPIWILAIIGPIVEKIWFYFFHLLEAIKNYRTAPSKVDTNKVIFFWQAFKNGSVSLIEDIVFHDPIYICLFLFLSRYPGIPIWLITFSSFFIAVLVVVWLEVTYRELKYKLFQRKLFLTGFKRETYFESRFVLNAQTNIQQTLLTLLEGLHLNKVGTLAYNDTYLNHKMPQFMGRSNILRLRCRTVSEQHANQAGPYMRQVGKMQSIQVVYTQVKEELTSSEDQFRFFLTRKEKFYFPLDYPMPKSPQEIREVEVKDSIRASNTRKNVSFQRIVMLGETGELLVTVDHSSDSGRDYVVELKAWRDPNLIIQAMRFIMTQLPATQTTMTKSELELF